MLLWCKTRIEHAGRRVLYGDTDSLFVESGAADAAAARSLGETLAAGLTRELAAHIQERWRVESRLELVFDRLVSAAVPADDAERRRRGPQALRRPGRFRRMAHASCSRAWRPCAATGPSWRRRFSASCTRGSLRTSPSRRTCARSWRRFEPGNSTTGWCTARLLRKPPEAYTTTTPPHVAVARQIGQKRRGRVSYVMTTAGAQSAESPHHPLDYEHYLDKQIRAVAEPVLTLLGLDLEQILGSSKQLRLF